MARTERAIREVDPDWNGADLLDERPSVELLPSFCLSGMEAHEWQAVPPNVREWLRALAEGYLNLSEKAMPTVDIGRLVHLLKSQEGVSQTEIYEEVAKLFGVEVETVDTYYKRYKRRVRSKVLPDPWS